jgi:3'(2'), 5'-bisphosphate nucleotidase
MTNDADLGRTLAAITEETAALILPLWRTGLIADSKADASPVTEADRRGEAHILRRLAEEFPDVPVVSEEAASEFGTPEEIGPRFFLVDPLDGTKAFVRGDPHFTVNIGLIQDGVPVAGAVNAPALGCTWYTTAQGAIRSDIDGERAARVRAWPAEPVALTSHTMPTDAVAALAEQYGFARTQPMDSSVKLCKIADGEADIYPRHGATMEWDIAAAHAVLLAAGGSLRAPNGEAFLYGKADKGFLNGWFVARGA